VDLKEVLLTLLLVVAAVAAAVCLEGFCRHLGKVVVGGISSCMILHRVLLPICMQRRMHLDHMNLRRITHRHRIRYDHGSIKFFIVIFLHF
jgi:hypothetical protein